MRIRDFKPLMQVQLVRTPEGEDLNRSKAGDKFTVVETRHHFAVLSRDKDKREAIVLGDDGAKNFRVCNDCKRWTIKN